jgi:magnesium transporter
VVKDLVSCRTPLQSAGAIFLVSLTNDHLELIAYEIESALHAGLRHVMPEYLKKLHPGDVAYIIQCLSPKSRALLIRLLKKDFDAEVLTHLDESVREEITRLLNPRELATAVGKLDSDDAFLVLEDLDEDQQKAVLFSIGPKERHKFEKILSYPKGSAARLMQREVVIVPNTWTVSQAIKHLAHNPHLPENFYYVFVIDNHKKPVGMISVQDLIRTQANHYVQDIMTTNINALKPNMDQEDVAVLFKRYNLLSAPVLDEKGRLLGVVTIDHVISVIDKEAEEDIMHMGGVSSSDFYANVFTTTLGRFQWLLVTFLNTLLASFVISHFQAVIEKQVALAILMPIVAAMGGNAGMQVVTVVVRAIATQELTMFNATRTVSKSILVSSLNGLIFACILSSIAMLWFHDLSLGLILGSAMFLNMLWAGLAGAMLPILIDRAGLDPALSAGPILTTTTDVLGFAIFLGIASLVLL